SHIVLVKKPVRFHLKVAMRNRSFRQLESKKFFKFGEYAIAAARERATWNKFWFCNYKWHDLAFAKRGPIITRPKAKKWVSVTDPQDITRLLHQWAAGDHDAGEQLFKLLMPDLRKLAARCLRREHPNHSLQRSELINECFLRLLSAKHIDWRDRGHFFAIVTIKMRRFLIDYARAKKINPIS